MAKPKFNTVAKITLNGETFAYDFGKQPMSELLAFERVLGISSYEEFQNRLGETKCVCALAWSVWKRNGRDIALESVVDGDVDFDYAELAEGLEAFAEEVKAATAEAGKANPTPPGSSPSTATSISRSSRSTTTSGRGK